MKSNHRWTLLLLAGGMVVHGAVLFAAYRNTGAIDGYAFRSLDGQEFYAIARNLAAHRVFSRAETPPFIPDTWRTPGYPLFLATIMLFFGHSAAALIVAQQVLSVVNAVTVFHVARRHMSNSRAALAAALFLLEPYHLYYSLWLLSTTWLVTLLLLAWLVWGKAVRSGELGWFVVLGTLCGFLVLTWPGAVLIPVALLGGVVVAAASQHPRPLVQWTTRAMTCGSVFAVTWAAVVGSWMMRNASVAGHFALSHQGGVVLAYFKATEVMLWRQGRTEDRYLETSLSPDRRDKPHPTWETIDERLRRNFLDLPVDQRNELSWPNLAQGNKTSLDSFLVSSELQSIATSYLAEAPLRTLACCTARCGSILTFPMDLALWPPYGVTVDRFRWGALGTLYSLLSLAVVVRLARCRIGFNAIYFPLASTLALLLAITPQTDPRFRVPMIPLLVFVALLPLRVATTRRAPAPDHRASTKGEPGRQKAPC